MQPSWSSPHYLSSDIKFVNRFVNKYSMDKKLRFLTHSKCHRLGIIWLEWSCFEPKTIFKGGSIITFLPRPGTYLEEFHIFRSLGIPAFPGVADRYHFRQMSYLLPENIICLRIVNFGTCRFWNFKHTCYCVWSGFILWIRSIGCENDWTGA